MARAGEPVTAIEAWLGHGDRKTTRALHVLRAGGRDAERVERAFRVRAELGCGLTHDAGVERRKSLVDDDRVQVGARGQVTVPVSQSTSTRANICGSRSGSNTGPSRCSSRLTARTAPSSNTTRRLCSPVTSTCTMSWIAFDCAVRSAPAVRRRERAPSFASTRPDATAPSRGPGARCCRAAIRARARTARSRTPRSARCSARGSGGPMLLEEHLDRDAVEATDGRHGVIVTAAVDGLGAGLIRGSSGAPPTEAASGTTTAARMS